MKKYLVTDKEVRLIDQILHIHSAGYTIEAEELPPGARVLTREEVARLITKHTYQSNEGLSDYTESLDSESMLDELFGVTP